VKINIVQVTNKKKIELSLMYYLCHDLVKVLLYTLEDLGHDVLFQKDQFDPSCLNIVVTGYHLLPGDIAALKKHGVPYVVYQAEIFSDMGLNNDNPDWVDEKTKIQHHYLNLIEGAIHTWDCFQFNQVFLKARGFESSHITHGYHPQLEGMPKKPEQDIDVVFFGSHTDYRLEIFKQLQKEGLKLKILKFEPPTMRDDALRRAKVNLSIKANSTTMAHLPHSRVMTGLYLNTLTVSDPVYGQEWLFPMIDIVPTEQITAHIVQIIQDGSYATKAKQYKELYMQHKMIDIMRPLMLEVQEKMSAKGLL
jgi:hypothetical protein